MQFQQGYLYHIYNQGNNRQKIFFKRENYLFFLKKIEDHILPNADILAWCLMPNHFHLMVLVREVELGSGSATLSRTPTPHTPTPNRATNITSTLNKSLGIMLASYTRALQKQENFTGSLFRQKTKAECVNCFKGLTPSLIVKDGITQNNRITPESQYPQVLFNYIHQNPVKAGLVNNDVDWEFSSARDYANLRNGKLINKQVAKKYIEWND